MTSADNIITIVSGLPRSGTSMMMRILDCGGMEAVTDEIRKADIDNPRGYYEFEIAKKIKTDVSWLPGTRGKAFKMVSMLLYHLPATYRYHVVFMRREMHEILASQAKMLRRMGKEPQPGEDARIATLFEQHLEEVQDWLRQQPHIRTLYVWYGDVMSDTQNSMQRIAEFLGRPLDVQAMTAVVDPDLYRNRT